MRRFLPSLCVLFCGVLVFLAGIHTLTSVNQDIGRHLTLGKIIWETHRVPNTNLFSYTAGDFPFINHHWLGEVLLYLGSTAIGLKGLIIAKALVLALAWGLVFAAGYRRRTFWTSLVAGLIALLILIERTDVRPEIFSFLFFAWHLFIVFRKSETRLIWTLPLVQLLWVNTHIYFFMGPLVYGLFLAQEYLDTKRVGKRHAWVGAGIAIATLINPHFWRGAIYPLTAFGNYGYSIVENQSPFFLHAFGYPMLTTWALAAGIAFVAASFLAHYRNIRHNMLGMGLFAITTGLALAMVRNYPLFALALMPIVGRNMAGSPKPAQKISRPAGIAALALLAALGVSIVTSQFYRQAGLGRSFGLEVPAGAQAAVDFVRAHHLRGPMFNNFDIGSFLIWKLPEEKVFIDGRPEAYPADFIQQVYIPMQEDPARWKSESGHYNIQYVFWDIRDITPWSQQFMATLSRNPQWPRVYDDGLIAVFVKNTPEHQPLVRAYHEK